MSVIQRIRDKGAWIMFSLIALALIGFIMQDRAFGGGRGGFFSNSTVVGRVNGVKIEHSYFEDRKEMLKKMYGPQAGGPEQLVAQVWSQETDKIINGEEYEKVGISVSQKELSELMFDEHSSPFAREFTDQTTHVFKANEAREAIAKLKKSKNAEQLELVDNAYVQPAIQNQLRKKYNDLFQKSTYIPKWLIEKQQADNNAYASISYVSVPYSTIADSLIKVSDEEILAYGKKHLKEYEKDEETRVLSYVPFSTLPSGSDTLATVNKLNELKTEFAATKDEKAFLGRMGTETPYNETYFSKAKVTSPKKDTLLKLGIGQTFGPYLDGSNFVVAKLVGIKQLPDSAKVRHILIASGNGQNGQPLRADSVAKRIADSIETAIKGGASFDSLCSKYTDDPGSKEKHGVYDFFPQGQMVPSFNDFSFDKPVGSKGVVKTDYGYHYIEVLGQKNPQPAYNFAYLAKGINVSQETENNAKTEAEKFSANTKTKDVFEDNAKKINKQVAQSGEIKENDYNIDGLGQSRSLVKWVYEHHQGDISEPTEVGDKFIVAVIAAINKKGLPSAITLRPMVENFVKNEKKAKQIIDTKFKGSTLEEYSKSSGNPIGKADSISFSNNFIAGIGGETKVLGAAFNKEFKGKATHPIVGSSGVFVIRVENIGAKSANSDAEGIKQQLMNAQRMASYRSMDALKKSATIKDYRNDFY